MLPISHISRFLILLFNSSITYITSFYFHIQPHYPTNPLYCKKIFTPFRFNKTHPHHHAKIFVNMKHRLSLVIRIAIFIFLWLFGVPYIFSFFAEKSHLLNLPGFDYPDTIISPIIFLMLFYFYYPILKKYHFKPCTSSVFAGLILFISASLSYLNLYSWFYNLYINGHILNPWLQLAIIYTILIGIYGGLFLAIFSYKFITSHKSLILTFFIFNTTYYILYYYLFANWSIFSSITTILVFHALKLFLPQTSMIIDGTNISLFINDFSVGISKTCSGVMLILLFFILYSLFCFKNLKNIKLPKTIFFLLIGTLPRI